MNVDISAATSLLTGPVGTVTVLTWLVVALVKGWLVPGFIYTETVDRLNKALSGLESTSASLDRLAGEIRDWFHRTSGAP